MKKQFLLILIVCVAPIVLANALFYFGAFDNLRGGDQHGILLSQAVPTEEFQAIDYRSNTEIHAEDLHEKWRLVAVVDLNNCDLTCENELVQMRQLRLALGEDLQRLKNTMLLTAEPTQASIDKYRLRADASVIANNSSNDIPAAPFPRFDILSQADDFIAQIQSAYAVDDVSQHIYLIDPLGNMVMRYPFGSGPEGKTEDLKRLFKYNQLG